VQSKLPRQRVSHRRLRCMLAQPCIRHLARPVTQLYDVEEDVGLCRSAQLPPFGTGDRLRHTSRTWRTLRDPSAGLRRLRLPRRALAERGLGGGEACEGNAERRARDVIERNLVAERDGGVLAADPDLELRLRLPTALDADPHQFAHALAVDGDERDRSRESGAPCRCRESSRRRRG
jgi:hypothetical protein